MILAERVVAYLLEEPRRDFVAVFGPKVSEQGTFMHNIADFTRTFGEWYPRYRGRAVEEIVDELVQAGHTFVIASKGTIRVISRNEQPQVSREWLNTLETELGLSDWKTIGFSYDYETQPKAVQTGKLFGIKPKPGARNHIDAEKFNITSLKVNKPDGGTTTLGGAEAEKYLRANRPELLSKMQQQWAVGQGRKDRNYAQNLQGAMVQKYKGRWGEVVASWRGRPVEEISREYVLDPHQVMALAALNNVEVGSVEPTRKKANVTALT